MEKNKLTPRQISNMWKMTYNFMNNVKTYMDELYREKNGNITENDYIKVKDYIDTGLNNITKIY
jgi:hypothetical protein